MANCYDSNPITMTLTKPAGGAYDFAPNFPLFGRLPEIQRQDPQGPAFKRLNITLSGFFEGDDHDEIIQQYKALAAFVNDNNNLIFNFTDGSTKIEDARRVYTNGMTIPEDWHQYIGDYTVQLYYFDDVAQDSGANGLQFTASYNGYTFTKLPAWKRDIKPARASHRSPMLGNTAVINLTGTLYNANHAGLMADIAALQTACLTDGTLAYGDFSQSCKIGNSSVGQAVMEHYSPYSIELIYDIGDVSNITSTRQASRLHDNPIITELPFCNTRRIKIMNPSGQEVSYSVSVTAATIASAKSQATTEVAGLLIPGGIELPGGSQTEDDRTGTYSINFRKFYNTPVISNLSGT